MHDPDQQTPRAAPAPLEPETPPAGAGPAERLRTEWRRLVRAASSIDRQTAFVLCAAALLVIMQDALGSRRLFRTEIGPLLPEAWRDLASWGWWFGMQGILGFVLPVLALRLLFKRSLREIGLALGDWKLAGLLALAYVPLVVAGTWVLSDQTAFQLKYPHFRGAATSWSLFASYQLLFLFYWFGWEYLWRGFVLFGTAHKLGYYAIFVQAMPFAILHVSKPLPEALLSLVGGVALGALVWRCRSFWIAVPIHFFQMLALDFWCSLRIRSGADGIGLQALIDVFGG